MSLENLTTLLAEHRLPAWGVLLFLFFWTRRILVRRKRRALVMALLETTGEFTCVEVLQKLDFGGFGDIYFLMLKLEEQGYVGSRWGDRWENSQYRRRLYSITPAGRRMLRETLKDLG